MLKSRLKVRMVEQKMSQTELAKILKVTKQTVNAWANEKLNPPLETALRIAELLECSVDDLWEYKEEDK